MPCAMLMDIARSLETMIEKKNQSKCKREEEDERRRGRREENERECVRSDQANFNLSSRLLLHFISFFVFRTRRQDYIF